MESTGSRPLMICLDIDGTTITHDQVLSPRVRDAVRRVVDAGHHVVMSTGRAVVATMPIVRQLGITTGRAVCSNGAVTVALDPSREEGFEVLEAVTFDPRPALTVIRERWPDGSPVPVVAVEELGVGFKLSAPFPDGELDGRLRVVPWEELMAEPVTRVTIRSPESTSAEFDELIDQIGLHEVSYAVGWSAWLDINPEGVSKGSALEQLRRQLGVQPGDTVAVGDQRNDLEMLRWAARGVAMGNAPDEVKAAADEVTGDVLEDGLADVLDSLTGSTS
ncbi:HAD family hydrolase [Janibacter massiliensis]|uniref:HAD family hydrolase n=1 Tax=Janibacter massiliensis TaxID=2058291 RepID=UPI000D0F62D2|nr:HAD-IIB family hydrolase [Janibacter massiliensis]